MKAYTDLHGFKFIRAIDCPEQSGVLVEYLHERTEAPLYYLDRPDSNMTFAIGFRTVPTDDTGVFHILEHSVLCGSRKYPVKDPFTELLKGSVSTYLNALTYGDRTVYPVSSLNKRAFLDLVSVYLDAVLHPLALENPLIFMQEGHRLEIEDGELRRNGIVFNEMRGAYSSPDELAAYYEGRLVFPGGCFGFDSGGNPDAIPTLTYEQFKAAHARYYHPTNSVMFLDGQVELSDVLALIDSYLSEYGVGERFTEIPEGDGIIREQLVIKYPVATADEEKDRTRVTLVRRCGTHADKNGYHTVSLAAEAIAGTNSAPLKKRILESGLCTNFNFYPVGRTKYPSFITRFTDVKDGKEEELLSLYREALTEILKEGISREALLAAINSTEFATREADYGSYPRGMVNMSAIMEDAVCGDEPGFSLKYNELFTFLREKLDTPHYVEALRELFASDEEAVLVMHPSASLEAENAEAERSRMAELYASLGEEEIERIKAQSAALEEWQATPDSPEALATVPALEISDLDDPPREVPIEVYREGATEVIRHNIPSDDITYLNLYFDISDIPEGDIPYATLLTLSISEFDTVDYSAVDFGNRIKTHIGGISTRVKPVKRKGEARLYLEVELSTLDGNKQQALDILSEYLYTRVFDSPERLERRISQVLAYGRESLIQSASGSCVSRGAASFDSFEALKELSGGFEYLCTLRDLEHADKAPVLNKLGELIKKYITRSRLTVSVTGAADEEFVRAVIGRIAEGGSPAGRCEVKPLPRENIGIAIAAPVAYATRISNLISEGGGRYHGALATLQTILDYEVLWNEIRVKGGAYGTGFICRANSGTVGYYSFRDPNPAGSIGVYLSTPDIARRFLADTDDLTKYIISTVGSMETVSTPRSDGSASTLNYLSGLSHADVIRHRDESLRTTKEELYAMLALVERADSSAVNVVAGPREKLEAMGLDRVVEL